MSACASAYGPGPDRAWTEAGTEPVLDVGGELVAAQRPGQQRGGVLGRQPGQPGAQAVVQSGAAGELLQQPLPGGPPGRGTDPGAEEDGELTLAGPLPQVRGE